MVVVVKRTLAVAVGSFLAGYAYAFVSALVASKNLGSRKLPPHPPGTCAEDCPWPDGHNRFVSWESTRAKAAGIRERKLTGEDMHDVLPTDDEYPEVSGGGVPYPPPYPTIGTEQPRPFGSYRKFPLR